MPVLPIAPRTLRREQVEAYHADGFLVLREVFAAEEMRTLADEAARLTARTDLIDKHNLRCRFQSHHASGECLFETFDPVIDIGPTCGRFARDARILDVLEGLYGEQACLFKDKLIFKPPGALGYRLHQDWIGWKGFPRSFLTVLVPIDAPDERNGCTEVFPGLHHRGCLTEEDGEFHELPPETVASVPAVPLVLRPGDVAVFGGFVPHRSQPNRSSAWRRQLYLSYNALSDGGEQRDAHYAEFRRYLRRRYAEHDLPETYFL